MMLICWPASPSHYGGTWPSGSGTTPVTGGKVVSGGPVRAGISQASVLWVMVMCRMKQRREQPLFLLPGGEAQGVFSHTNLCSPGLWPH